jgi:TolB-like protein/DNA-binding winged helix-turn-helix (wHTH) protein/Tfp pilus assembly protein PilF
MWRTSNVVKPGKTGQESYRLHKGSAVDAFGSSDVLLFDQFRLHSRGGGLFRQDAAGAWTPVEIGARALEVLGVLVERHGDVVSRDEIMRAVWPGIAVEEHNLTVQISTLRRVLDQGRSGDSCIRTVPGRGYRLVASRPGPPRLSIVVLPFENLSGDRSEDYLAEAITDDLTTDLSRIPGMLVVARQSAYAYRRSMDVRKIGEELSVRYALKGSMRRLGSVLRVNAQLLATETGSHLWADRFDQQLKDLSAGQEEIVRRVGHTLNVAVMDIESARSKRERPTNPDAFDLIIRAQSIHLHPMGLQEHEERIGLFQQALRLDPSSVLALSGLATELTRLTAIANTEDELEQAAALIETAAAISPNHRSVLDATAYLLFHQGRNTEAFRAYERLLDEYPNHGPAYNQMGYCLVRTGRAEEAIPMIERAIRLDPRSPFNYSRYENMSMALLMIGRDEEAIGWSQRALAANPTVFPHLRAQHNIRMAAANARLGYFDEAHRLLTDANRIWPYDTVRTHWPDDPSSTVLTLQIERYQAALRLAGHRDHAEEEADFGIAPDAALHRDLAGLTPIVAPGATTIRTAELQQLLAERRPIVIDPMMYSWGRSIPGAIGLKRTGWGSSFSDAAQGRLCRKMQTLAEGDLSTPIVAIGFNSERFDGRNLALRLVKLGYTNVYWYRSGREAWEANGLPERAVDVQPW